MERKVRVRFAPSPTGPLHMGGVRTALYNYLFARQHGGDFILRIEDTDSQRFVPGAEKYILDSLAWCGIRIDEGVAEGGPHAPYRQSERREIYLKYAQQLVESGHAYYAFDTQEELASIRAEAESRGQTFAYNHEVRGRLATSLALPAEEVRRRMEAGEPWVVRFMMPENEQVHMHDLIRGDVTVNTSTLDDKVLYKSADALPTYHLANIVDDHLMEISHVIRGEEWLPSLPLHYLLYRAFGWSDSQPPCRCCSSRPEAASSASATATRWASRSSRCAGCRPTAKRRTDTARTAIFPKRSSTCWRCWAGIPERNRKSSRWTN